MPSVNIYIECNITGIKPADGKTIVIIEYVSSNGKTATKTIPKDVTKLTAKEAVLQELIHAFKQLNRPCEVYVYVSEHTCMKPFNTNVLIPGVKIIGLTPRGNRLPTRNCGSSTEKCQVFIMCGHRLMCIIPIWNG